MKSKIVEFINKILWEGEISNYNFIIIHRGAPGDEKNIPGEDVTGLKDRFLILRDGSKIPIHRIKIIRKIK
ncbi:MAG: DUF504 domain-containing protein [Candidatus Aenigmarchaeota archaeon]|nr:DUF504 domain-containing protein [Candidatus Aenigmarchaeota archaeon]